MLIQALLFSKVETNPKISLKRSKIRKRKKECTASKVCEYFTLVNSVWERHESISFLKPITGVDEVIYPPGTKFEMVEVWVDVVSLFDSASIEWEPSLRVLNHNLNIVRRLLPDNTKIKRIDEFEIETSEDLVFCGRNLLVIEKLLQSDATISYRHGAEIGTLAHYAALRKSTYLIPVLQRCGVDLNGVSNDGRTPLHIAIQIKDLEIVKVLLNNGANPNVAMANGSSPLHLAILCKFTGAVVVLIENGADVNATNKDNQSPFAVASEVDDAVSMEIMLTNGVSLNSAATHQKALVRAVQHNAFGLAQRLLEHGAKANQKHTMKHLLYRHSSLMVDEATPLHVACAFADEKMVQLLLDHGADPNVVCGGILSDEKNRLPISIAVARGAEGIAKLLLKNGATVYKHRNILTWTLKKPKTRISLMKLLLEHGCDLNVKKLCKSSKFVDALNSLDTKSIDLLMLYEASSILLEIYDEFLTSFTDVDQILKTFLSYIFTDLEETIEMKLRKIFNSISFDGVTDSDDSDSEYGVDFSSPPSPSSYSGRCAKILAKHLVKLTVAGKQIDGSVIPFNFNRYFHLDDFRAECKDEIEFMKGKMICETPISLYDVLTKNTNTVSRHLKNENIRLALINYEFEKEFPQYGRIIQCQVRRADLKLEFSREGMKSFNWLVCRLPRLPHELKEGILGLLSIKDLIQLRLCFPSK